MMLNLKKAVFFCSQVMIMVLKTVKNLSQFFYKNKRYKDISLLYVHFHYLIKLNDFCFDDKVTKLLLHL